MTAADPRLDALATAVRESLVGMALVDAVPIRPHQVRRSTSPVCWSWVEFQAPRRGRLCLVQPLELGRDVVAIMTGVTVDRVDDADAVDALGELCNVIAGRFLRYRFGDAAAPIVGIPRSGRGTPDIRRGRWRGQTFRTGDWWLAVFVSEAAHDPATASVEGTDHRGATTARPGDVDIGREETGTAAYRRVPSGILPPATGRIAATDDAAEVDAELEPGDYAAAGEAPLTTRREHRHTGVRDSVIADHAAVPVVGIEDFIAEHPDAFPHASTAAIRASRAESAGAAVRGADPVAVDPIDPAPAPGPAAGLSGGFVPPPAADDDDLIGTGPVRVPRRIGNYRLIEAVGHGGMATVFRGEHATLLRQVAVKVLDPELAEDAGFVDSFLLEARHAARVEHPNVVPVYDADEDRGFIYLVLRYIATGDLGQRIAADGPLPIADACALCAGCADGLGAIAEAGLVHRDIKPGNILIGEDGAPLIGDLGLTRPSGYDARSRTTGNRGTPAYMAPEQLEEGIALDIRCDIYGLAASLYAALTGQPPYAGSTAVEVLRRVIEDPIPDPRALRGDCDAALAALVQRCLDKDPARRVADPAELADALRTHARHGAGRRHRSAWIRRLFGL